MSTEAVSAQSTADTEQPEAPASLAEFREAFPQAPKDGQPPPEPAVERPARRSKSHQAEAKDVPEIAALTKQLREAEDAIKIDRKDGESDRVFQLRKRAEIAKRAAAPAPAVVERPAIVERPAVVAQPIASEFTEKLPELTDFANEPDPYDALFRARARWDRRKDAFDESQKAHKTTLSVQQETFDREIDEGVRAHAQRAHALAESRADVKALFEAEWAKPKQDQIQLPLALRGAMEFHERGAEMVVALLQDRKLARRLFLLTDGRAIGDPRTDHFVAEIRRELLDELEARTSGVASGSPAPQRQIKIAPRPPNPERTVPQTPRESSPTEAAGSLAAHRATLPAHLRH